MVKILANDDVIVSKMNARYEKQKGVHFPRKLNCPVCNHKASFMCSYLKIKLNPYSIRKTNK